MKEKKCVKQVWINEWIGTLAVKLNNLYFEEDKQVGLLVFLIELAFLPIFLPLYVALNFFAILDKIAIFLTKLILVFFELLFDWISKLDEVFVFYDKHRFRKKPVPSRVCFKTPKGVYSCLDPTEVESLKEILVFIGFAFLFVTWLIGARNWGFATTECGVQQYWGEPRVLNVETSCGCIKGEIGHSFSVKRMEDFYNLTVGSDFYEKCGGFDE